MKWLIHWFWAPVRESENWAQTLVRVLGNLTRIAITASVALAGVVYVSMVTEQRRQEQRRVRAESIEVSVSPPVRGSAPNDCPAELPLVVTVQNRGDLALMSMEIELSARRRGMSTELLYGYRERRLRWSHIVPPQHGLSLCYRLSDAPMPDAIYTAKPVDYTVVTQESEPWMIEESSAQPLAPPCRDGSTECEPWERDWGSGPPSQGAVVSPSGAMTQPR